MPLLNPGASVAFEVPLWAQPVISSERGPIVIAGESHGVRLAAVGFEILPFEGARTPATSILSLNMLSWLLSSTGGVEGLTLPGTIHRLDPAFDWKVRGSDGEVPVRLDEAKHPSVLLARPGVYQLDGSPHGSGQSRSESLIVNVLIPEESQVAVPAPIRVPDQVEHQKKAVDLARPLWPLIIWAVIGLLMLETASRLFRRKVA